jgi:clan AA aspartic protease
LGHTSAKVKLYSPDLSKSEEVELLVDTGSTYSWIPKGILERLNIEPKGSWKFKTVDGRTLERKIGEALMECMGEKATRMVVFAEDGDATILGVDALEGLRLEIDPITKRLKKAEALLAL